MKRRWISLMVTLVMLVSLFPAVTLTAAAASTPTAFWVEAEEMNGIPAKIDVFKANTGTYQLYLPGQTDPANCFLSWDGGLQATVDGLVYESGACPVPPVDTEKTYSFRNGYRTTTFKIVTYQGSDKVEPVFIDIDESGDNPTIAQMDGDKNHNVTCTGRINIDGQWYGMPKIKGRGNVTWSQAKDKRPYNINLDSKITFPGIDSAATKKWTFLGEILDHSLLCNRSGFSLAHEIGVGQDTASADVWMNGEYQGCYTVTPKTDSYVPKNGFMIEEDNYLEEKVENGGDPQFQLDGLKESSGWSSCYNRITVKKMGDNLLLNDAGEVDESPANLESVALGTIKPWLQDALDAILSDNGYNSKGRYYTDYIDIDSFAKMYLMHEYVKSYDVCAGSLLFHRDGNTDSDKLIAGPLWDLDNALGATLQNSSLGNADDRRNGDRRSAEGVFIQNVNEYKTSIYKNLGKHPDFMQEVRKQYNRSRAAFDQLPENTAQMITDIEASARMNHIKVTDLNGKYSNIHKYENQTTLGSSQYRQTYLATTDSKTDWGNYTANLMTYITTRTLWFSNNYYDPSYVDPASCEHEYEQVVFPAATCTADGLITFTCPICGDSYEESIPKTAHDYQDGACSICGETLLTAAVSCGSGASVTVYETKDTDGAHEDYAEIAYPRDSDTGLIDCSGEGQINFVVNLDPGYELLDVTAEPAGAYKNLKKPDETGITNGYRLTKVKGDVRITVTTKLSEPEFKTHALILASEIGVRFRVSFPQVPDPENCRMEFELPDGRTESMDISEAEPVENTTDYWFTCYINPLELAEEITATLYYGEGGTFEDTYSAMEYIEYIQQNSNDDIVLLNLVNALQDYGYYMQKSGWTDGKESHVDILSVNAEINDQDVVRAKDSVEEMQIVKELDGSGIEDVKIALSLNEATTIRVSFKPDSETTITSSGGKARTIGGETYYQFSTEKIGAARLGTPETISVDTDKGTASVKASAMSYVYAALSSNTLEDAKKTAMTAYYNYFKAADEYVKQAGTDGK